MAKRAVWDFNVNITVRNIEMYGKPSQKLTFPISALAALGFFANCPPLEDGDLEVDLVQQGLSPYPITADGLKGIVELLQPFAVGKPRNRRRACRRPSAPDDPLGDWREDRGCIPRVYELLECVDVLCLDYSACQGLDDLVATGLEHERTLMYCEELGGSGYYARIALNDRWALEGNAMHQLQPVDGDGWRTDLRAEVVLPIVRWAVLQLYSKLDSIGFHRSQRVLAKHMVRPGDKLLYGDAAWAQQLSAFQSGGLMSDEGRSILFEVAVSAPKSSDLMPWMQGVHLPSFDANLRDVLLGQEVELPGGIKLRHCDDCCIIMPLAFTYPDPED